MTDEEEPLTIESLGAIQRLTKDLKKAVVTLGKGEARFLVDAYYAMQRDRIRSGNQEKALTDSGEPHTIVSWLYGQRETLERQVARALDYYSDGDPHGRWARSIVGIGPVITAGLLAHIDIERCDTAGKLWRYAGLDPTVKWKNEAQTDELLTHDCKIIGKKVDDDDIHRACIVFGRAPATVLKFMDGKRTRATLVTALKRQPWNAKLKRLCWLIGESFVKSSGHEKSVYGPLYAERKAYEQLKNEKGEYADQAKYSLENVRFGADTEARKHYEAGRLPPARIHLRSQRYAVKLFLSHFQHVGYELANGTPPPKPYILNQPNHTHFLAPPNWPMPEVE